MKTNKQILKLMESGFRPSTLQNLTDGQINALYNRIVESSKEQKESINPVAPDPNRKEFEVTGTGPEKLTVPPNLKNVVIQNKPGETARITLTTGKQKNKGEKVIQDGEMKEGDETSKKIDKSELKFLKNLYKNAPTEKIKNMISKLEMEISKSEMKEDDSLGSLAMQDYTGQEGPHDEKDMAPDGMDDDSDNDRKMMGEGRKKKSKAKNPWAICTATMGKEFGTTERSDWTKPQMKKYERCVMDVKKSIKEGKNPYEVILERQILSLMEKELYPRMTKSELLKTISEKKKEVVIIDESEPAPAPVKPDVKPDTDRKPRRRPGQVPGPDPSPKAKRPEEKKKKYMSLISKILRNEE